MKPSNVVLGLCILIGSLSIVAAGLGLFWQDGGTPVTFTTVRGQTVNLYGQGLYRYDTLFAAGSFKGTDVVTLALGLPLLAFFGRRYKRGSLRGGLVLTGVLGYFLYVYASMALKAAYNNLFLVYIVLFSASLYAFILALRSIDPATLTRQATRNLPRRGPGIFMIASGIVTLIIWLLPLITALMQNQPPELLESYTTSVTDTLDLGIITPAAIIAGMLILRREPLGYLIACSLLILEIMLTPMIAMQTVFQLQLGITFTPGQIIGPIIGFVLLGVLALWVMIAILRPIPEPAASSTIT